MTKEYFLNKRFKPFEVLMFENDRHKIECIVLSIDFEQRIFKLSPIETDLYENNDFFAHIDYVHKLQIKLKNIK